MNSNDNMLYAVNVNSYELKNKGFLFLDTMFRENGWVSTKNEIDWLCYTKPGFETEFFEIKIDSSKIYVSIPLKNSIFQYSTSFKNYFSASEYIEERFKDFIL
jgi:hypothetical protein